MYNTCVSLVQTNIARERAVLHSKAMCCLSSLWVGAVFPSKMVTTCRCLGQNTLWIPGCCFGCGCDSRDMRFLRGLAMDACQCAFARRIFCPELRLRLTNITCAKSMRSGTESTTAAATCCGEVWMVQHCACGTARSEKNVQQNVCSTSHQKQFYTSFYHLAPDRRILNALGQPVQLCNRCASSCLMHKEHIENCLLPAYACCCACSFSSTPKCQSISYLMCEIIQAMVYMNVLLKFYLDHTTCSWVGTLC